MESRQSTPSPRMRRPRYSMQRQRSNSFPIVEALGCSTPEALIILAEGRAAVRKRRARRNQSVDAAMTAFNPQDHLKFLEGLAAMATPQEQTTPFETAYSRHSRMPSDATDTSTSTASTVVPDTEDAHPRTLPPTINSYSANLAQFIKNQLNSIPTYQSNEAPGYPLSPRSCPDLASPTRLSHSVNPAVRRHQEGLKVIDIPPVRPPVKSQFSAWSSTDEETPADGEAPPLPESSFYQSVPVSKGSNYTPSVLSYYETADSNSSFLFSSTPLEEDSAPDAAKSFTFPHHSALPSSSPEHQHDDDYPSSSSQPQLTFTSAPSYTSSSASVSYFDCKRPRAITPHMKERVVAAVTPAHLRNKRFTAVSPWEGSALSNVHDVYYESQQRVNVDGMTFDMLREFSFPNKLTPC
ncbi:hypothetical protein GMOD_00005854 [Pyrenophora seminiperda CCB06]|uniref:Uncharacterized protein n=1 Tax=Pyrenophora seminiperda CCB06 TaxID=1302712 RepID=A0A3M7MA53_9PLEO|nr:hypothetical protein GMOD_00005854 [Pyrenophora seminiperda CCB06]